MVERAVVYCKRDCLTCKNLNTRVDDKGYPFAYECIKYDGSAFKHEFKSKKGFQRQQPNTV